MFYKYQKNANVHVSTTTCRNHYRNGQKQGDSPLKLFFRNAILDSQNFKYWGLSCVSQRSRPLKESSMAFEKLSRQSLRLLSWKQRTLRDYFFTFESKHNPFIVMHFLIFNWGSYLNSNIEKAGNWLLCLNSFFLVTDMDFIILKVTD